LSIANSAFLIYNILYRNDRERIDVMNSISPSGSTPLYEQNRLKEGRGEPARDEGKEPVDSLSQGTAERPGEPQAGKKKWTILLYSAADNNLERYMVQDVIDLESVGSDANTNLLAQVDRGERPSSLSGGWAGCRRFFLEKDGDSSAINSPPAQDLGQVNMSDPQTLTDFLVWGMKNYPADHVFLVISDHGNGWKGAMEDDSHHGWMKTKDINKAIEDAEKIVDQKLDIVGFDACLMASSEVGYELKDSAGFLVASENTEGADGWPYPQIFTSQSLNRLQRAISHKLDLPPEEVAKKVVKEAEGVQGTLATMSATDLSRMKDLAGATDAFAEKLIATPTDKQILKSIIQDTQSFYGYKDQIDFCERLIASPSVSDEELKAAAKTMMAAVKNAVIAEQHSPSKKGAHGLTIELPAWGGGPSEEYKGLKLSQDTKWDEAIGGL
jgi:hypothetical protein